MPAKEKHPSLLCSRKSSGNLKPFKKGRSGNPAGRKPNHRYFSEIARQILSTKKIKISYSYPTKRGQEHKVVEVSSDQSIVHGIIAVLAQEALSGNVTAAKELIDRVEGKAPQSVDFTSDGDKIDSSPVIQVVDNQAATAVKKMFKK